MVHTPPYAIEGPVDINNQLPIFTKLLERFNVFSKKCCVKLTVNNGMVPLNTFNSLLPIFRLFYANLPNEHRKSHGNMQ